MKKNPKNLMILTAAVLLSLLASPVWAKRDLSVLEYNPERPIIGILGVEKYHNIDQEQYGKIEWIEAAKDELWVCLKDDQELEVVFDIAEEYKMEVLERLLESSPFFRLRFIQDKKHQKLEKVWAKLYRDDDRVDCVGLNAVVYSAM